MLVRAFAYVHAVLNLLQGECKLCFICLQALSSVEECRRSEVRKSWELDSAHQHTAQMHAIRFGLET